MQELPKDIVKEMKVRFNSDFDSAKKILNEYLTNYEYLNSDRIIRCVIFLADNGIESFKSFLESAKGDPRDVMWWAEYENRKASDNNKRVRDFNKTFQENGI
ncbi:hypothetical protein HN014_22000 [Aquimarina sp. TRL1]|uniref:hypothetical protein n=1 Tax=Aquimarina sp. (strain TRL1) TaxID=2736252 RepID=UPI00158870FA|nr:hypothetical protein [Aquimarina sp. TRL1]QKX07476.1 hypothetical protein HN014_22000 [Aquimarina sp. TRL1]